MKNITEEHNFTSDVKNQPTVEILHKRQILRDDEPATITTWWGKRCYLLTTVNSNLLTEKSLTADSYQS
jgi:hypothetical protein